MSKQVTVSASNIQAGDTLHLARGEDFTTYSVERNAQGQVVADVGEGRIYFHPDEPLAITREG